MGSFNSVCSISSVTLTYQKVARILLLPTHVSEYIDPDTGKKYNIDSRNILQGAGQIVTDTPFDAFVPFGFPIYGNMSDGSNLIEIESDENILRLEEFFGLPIDKILEAASDKRWYTYGILAPQNYREKLAEIESEIGVHMQKDRSDANWEATMEKLSSKLDQHKEREYYETEQCPKKWGYGDHEIKNVQILLDLTYTDIHRDIFDFLTGDSMNIHYRVCHSSDDSMEEVNKYLTYRNEKCDIKDAILEARNNDNFNEAIDALLEKLETLSLIREEKIRNILGSPDTNFLTLIPYDINSNFVSDSIVRYVRLSKSLWVMHKILMPSNYGSQHTNYALLKDLNYVVNSILNSSIEKYNRFNLSLDDDVYPETKVLIHELVSKLDSNGAELIQASTISGSGENIIIENDIFKLSFRSSKYADLQSETYSGTYELNCLEITSLASNINDMAHV